MKKNIIVVLLVLVLCGHRMFRCACRGRFVGEGEEGGSSPSASAWPPSRLEFPQREERARGLRHRRTSRRLGKRLGIKVEHIPTVLGR